MLCKVTHCAGCILANTGQVSSAVLHKRIAEPSPSHSPIAMSYITNTHTHLAQCLLVSLTHGHRIDLWHNTLLKEDTPLCGKHEGRGGEGRGGEGRGGEGRGGEGRGGEGRGGEGRGGEGRGGEGREEGRGKREGRGRKEGKEGGREGRENKEREIR